MPATKADIHDDTLTVTLFAYGSGKAEVVSAVADLLRYRGFELRIGNTGPTEGGETGEWLDARRPAKGRAAA